MTETATSAEAVKRLADHINTLQISGDRVECEYLDVVPGMLRDLAAKVEALEARCELLREGQSTAYMRGEMGGRDKERERAAQIAEQWIAKDMREQMEPGAIEQNAIARQIAAAIRKGDE